MTLIYIILAVIAAYELSGIIAEFVQDRYMITIAPCGIRRRWYGKGCQVAVHYADIRTAIDWQHRRHEPVFVKLRSDDGEVSWMPAPYLAPVSVPVFRPSLRGLRLTAQRPYGEIQR